MESVKVKVVKSTPTENGSWCTKVVTSGEGIETELGRIQGRKKTYYVFTEDEWSEDAKVVLDFDKFNQEVREIELKDEETDEPITVHLTYLNPKEEEKVPF